MSVGHETTDSMPRWRAREKPTGHDRTGRIRERTTTMTANAKTETTDDARALK